MGSNITWKPQKTVAVGSLKATFAAARRDSVCKNVRTVKALIRQNE